MNNAMDVLLLLFFFTGKYFLQERPLWRCCDMLLQRIGGWSQQCTAVCKQGNGFSQAEKVMWIFCLIFLFSFVLIGLFCLFFFVSPHILTRDQVSNFIPGAYMMVMTELVWVMIMMLVRMKLIMITSDCDAFIHYEKCIIDFIESHLYWSGMWEFRF